MLKHYRIIFYSILLIGIFVSCNKVKQTLINPPALSIEDSLIAANIESDLSIGNIDSGLIKIKQISNQEKYSNHSLLKLKLLNIKARLLTKSKKYDQALETCDEIINICEKNMEELRIPYVHANLVKGDIYFDQRNYQSAYKYYFQGRNSLNGFEADCEYAQYDYRVAIILFKQTKYSYAIENFKKAYSKYLQCNKTFNLEFRLQEILSNIGICYYKLGNYDSSLVYYNKSYQYLSGIQPKDSVQVMFIEIAQGVNKGNLGKLYLKEGKIETAISLLKQNITINTKEKHDYNDALTSINALANHYLITKNFDEFIKVTNIANYIPNINKYSEQLKNLYKLKSEYYETQKNYKLAFEYQTKQNIIKDSLYQIQQNNTNSDIQLTLKSLENESKLNNLIAANQLRSTYIYIGVSIAVALIIYLITLSIFLKYSTQKNKALKVSNKEIYHQRELLNKANQEILYNLDVLKSRDLEKNKILSIVAHDLRNPNNAILSIVDTLLESKNLDEEQKELIGLIKTSANSNNDLIQEILHFAKPGQFANSTDYVNVNCRELLEQTVSLNLFKASQKQISIELIEVDPRIEINVQLEKIRRALSNVIINAIKFSHHNTTIKIFTTNTLEIVNIHIKDQGIGIPDRIKGAIFVSDPIIRRLGTDGEASFGLGLSIVKQTIEDHKGKISFQSDNNGTEFIISLPIVKQKV